MGQVSTDEKEARGRRRASASLVHGLAAAAIALAGVALAHGEARAQADACARYQAELEAIERGADQDYRMLAERQWSELERMRAYYRSLNCGQSRFLIFGAPSNPECRAAEDRLAAMEDNYQRLLREASRTGNDRRQALLAAIDQACNVAERPRGFFDNLFGQPDDRFQDDFFLEDEQEFAGGGSFAVCVRSCDGFFFPLGQSVRDANAANALCQARCPSAAASVFFKQEGAPIETAVDTFGQPYTMLPNALRYRTVLDPACSCRAEGQSWAEVLHEAESMLAWSGGELVTPERAAELSRPREAAATSVARPASGGAEIPFFGLDYGEVREVDTQEGRRRVRIVAPELIPVPDTM